MSQQEILEILAKKPQKWWTAKDISVYSKTSPGSISCCLKKLLKYNEVFKKTPEKGSYYFIKPRGAFLWKIRK